MQIKRIKSTRKNVIQKQCNTKFQNSNKTMKTKITIII